MGEKILASDYYALYRGAQKLLGYPVRNNGGAPSHGAASSRSRSVITHHLGWITERIVQFFLKHTLLGIVVYKTV